MTRLHRISSLALLLALGACSKGSPRAPLDAGGDAGAVEDGGMEDAGVTQRPWTCDRVSAHCANTCSSQPDDESRRACDQGCVPAVGTKHGLTCTAPGADLGSTTCDDVLAHCQKHCNRVHKLLRAVCMGACPSQRATASGLTCTFAADDSPTLFPPAPDCPHVTSICAAECEQVDPAQKAACTAGCPSLLASHSGLTCP